MTPAFGTLRVFDDKTALAHGAAAYLTERAKASSGRFIVAASGGSTPKPIYEALGQEPLRSAFPWDRVQWILGDERFVAESDPASNFGMMTDAMFSHVPVPRENVHPVPFAGLTPEQGAAAYEALLKRFYGSDSLVAGRFLLDVNLLGMGDDGHTASLLPGQPVLDERTRWAAAVEHGRTEPRVTLTYPALESSALTVFLIAGEGKRAMLDEVLSGGSTVPTARLRPQGETLWFVDRAAAGRWAA